MLLLKEFSSTWHPEYDYYIYRYPTKNSKWELRPVVKTTGESFTKFNNGVFHINMRQILTEAINQEVLLFVDLEDETFYSMYGSYINMLIKDDKYKVAGNLISGAFTFELDVSNNLVRTVPVLNPLYRADEILQPPHLNHRRITFDL